jgi:hypothetical protein
MEVADMPKPRQATTSYDCGATYATSAIDTVGPVNPLDEIGAWIEPHPNGCWLWTGALSPSGYGQAQRYIPGQFTAVVHRIVYQVLVGPIPEGYVLHHRCEVKACCNPEHLTPMTNSDHTSHHAELRRAS